MKAKVAHLPRISTRICRPQADGEGGENDGEQVSIEEATAAADDDDDNGGDDGVVEAMASAECETNIEGFLDEDA